MFRVICSGRFATAAVILLIYKLTKAERVSLRGMIAAGNYAQSRGTLGRVTTLSCH